MLAFFCVSAAAQEGVDTPIHAGAESLHVEDAVAQALAHNLSLQREELVRDSVRQNDRASFRVFYPDISVNGALTILNEAPVAIPGVAQPQNIFSADVTAQLPLDFRVFSAFKLTKLQYQSGEIGYEQASQALTESVQSLFYTLLLFEERIKIGEESVKIATERADDTQIRFDIGVIDEYTLLTAQVNVINAQTALDTIRTEYQNGVRQFNVLLGNDIDRSLILMGEIAPDVFNIDATRVVNELLPISPAIRNLQTAVHILEANRGIQIGAFLPQFLFRYQFQQSYERDFFSDFGDIGNADNWRTGGGFTATLSIPLGNLLPFSNTWIAYYDTQRELQGARLALEENTSNIAIQIYAQVDTLHRIGENIVAKQINVQRAERAFSVAQEGYRTGLRNILEVRDAQNQLDTAQIDYLNERFNYISTQISLATQLGIDVDILSRYRVRLIQN